MSSSVVNRTVNIYINQASAERAQKILQNEQDKLNRAIAKGSKEGKSMVDELKKLGEVEKKINILEGQMSGKFASTINQVKKHVAALNKELIDMGEDHPEFNNKVKQWQDASAHLQQMQLRIKGVGTELAATEVKTSSFLSKMKGLKDQIMAVAAGTLISNTIQMAFMQVVTYLQSLMSGNALRSDILADVRMTTGMAQDEVQKLDDSLGKLNTRTTKNDLLGIAKIGGQFNVAKEDMDAFVETVDKVNVVLGSEFGGGAEQITRELSLLRNVFLDIKTNKIDEDLLHIGNALITLAQEGAATAPGITEFAKRLAPLEATAHLTSGAILGLSSTLEELAVNPERGGTAVVRLFQKMTDNMSTFAQVAGMADAEFEKLLRQDSFAAFQEVLKGFAKGGDDILGMSQMIEELELNGVGAREVLVKLSTSSEMLQQRVDLATESLTNATAITEQFAVKNDTLGARLDKLGKQFETFVTSRGMTEFLKSAVSAAGSLISVLQALTGFIAQNAAAVALWSAAYLLNAKWVREIITLKKLERLEILATTAVQKADIIVTTALSLVKAALTGNMVRLRQEWLLLRTTMMASNPFVALLVVLGAVIVAYNALVDKVEEVNRSQQLQMEIAKKVNDATGETMAKVKLYTTILNDNNTSLGAKQKALQDLIALDPAFLQGLTLANIKTAEGKKLLDAYVGSLMAKAQAEANQSTYIDMLKRRNELSTEYDNWLKKHSATENRLIAKGQRQRNMLIPGFLQGGEDDKVNEMLEKKKQIEELNLDIESMGAKVKADANTSASAATAATAKAQQQVIAAGGSIADIASMTNQAITQEIKNLDDAFKRLDGKNKALLDANATRKKMLQDELTHRKGNQTSEEKQGEKHQRKLYQEAEEAKRHLEAAFAEVHQLQTALEDGRISADEREEMRVRNKYARLLAEFKKYITSTTELANAQASLSAMQQEELAGLYEKFFNERSDKEYKQSVIDASGFFDRQRQEAMQSYQDGLIDKATYTQRLKELNTDEAEALAQIAQDYAANSVHAAKDLEQKKTEALQRGIQEREQLEQKAAEDAVYSAERALIVAPKLTDQALDAQKAFLEAKFQQETLHMDRTSEAYLTAQAALNKSLKDADKEYMVAKATQWLDTLQGLSNVFGSYMQLLNQRTDQELQSYQESNNAKKASLKKRLDAGVIDQAAYDREVSKMDEAMAAKERAAKRERFGREKAAALIDAGIKTAQAVLQALASSPPPYSYVLAAAAGVAGAAQMAIIAKQKPAYRKGGVHGGVPDGGSHEQGGIALIDRQSGQEVGEMEGGEPYMILSKGTYANNRGVIDALLKSSMKDGGKAIDMSWLTAAPPPINTGRLLAAATGSQLLANGGFLLSKNSPGGDRFAGASMGDSNINSSRSDSNMQSIRQLISYFNHAQNGAASGATAQPQQDAAMMAKMQQTLDALNAQLKAGIKGHVYYNEYEQKSKEMAELRRSSSLAGH